MQWCCTLVRLWLEQRLRGQKWHLQSLCVQCRSSASILDLDGGNRCVLSVCVCVYASNFETPREKVQLAKSSQWQLSNRNNNCAGVEECKMMQKVGLGNIQTDTSQLDLQLNWLRKPNSHLLLWCWCFCAYFRCTSHLCKVSKWTQIYVWEHLLKGDS